MQRREFLHSTLALGAAALIPNAELAATNDGLPDFSTISADELEMIETAARRTGPLSGSGRVLSQKEVEAIFNGIPFSCDLRHFAGLVLPPLNDSEAFDLLVYAIEKKHLEFVKSLIKQGVDVNAKNLMGWTPLDYAVTYSSVEVVQYLISQGADVHAQNNKGKTALDTALESARELEKRETDPKYAAKMREAIEILERAMGKTVA